MRNLSLRWVFIGCLICLVSIAQAQGVFQIQTQSGLVPIAREGLQAALSVQTSAEYRIRSYAVFSKARQVLDIALANKNLTACLEQPNDFALSPPAVTPDIDETVLDNSSFQGQLAKRDAVCEPGLWTEWVNLQQCG